MQIFSRLSKWRNASTNRLVFSAAVLIGVLGGVARLASIGKELIVASVFGTSGALDAFLIAYLVPSFVLSIAAGSMSAAFIPVYIQTIEEDGRPASERLFNSALGWGLLFLALLTSLTILAAPVYLPLLGSGFDPAQTRLAISLLYVLSPIILLSGAAAFLSALLHADHGFALPAIVPILTPLIITMMLVFAGLELGVFALAIGTMLGQLMEAALLFGAVRSRWPIRPMLPRSDPRLKQVLQQYLNAAAGATLMGSTQIVDQAFAAALPAGSVSALSYGTRLVTLPLTLAATALGTAVLPFFSRMAGRGDFPGLRHSLRKYLLLIFAVCIPVTLVLVVLSEPLVRLILQRGAFTGQDSALVARVQALAALQIPFYLGGILVVRTLSSLQANHVLLWGTVINVVVNIVTDLIFIKLWGLPGIALSTSVVYLVSFTFLLIWLLLLLRERR